MGLGPRWSSASIYCTPAFIPKAPNPDPANFEIKAALVIMGHTIMRVHYPDATTYEGNKILFFRNTHFDEIKKQKTLDPHFSRSKKFYSPFARFEPTDEGWNAACALAHVL